MNITEGVINDNLSFACYGLEVREDEGVITLGPSKASCEVFLLREEGPLGIITTNEKIAINYGGEFLLEIVSSEEQGHVISMLNELGETVHAIRADEYENGVEQDFGAGKVTFDDQGSRLDLVRKDESVGLEISVQVEGFEERRRLKYAERDGRRVFEVVMLSRIDMNREEIERVKQALLERNQAGVRSASLGIARSAVAGAIMRSFDVFIEHELQVIKNNVPVIELKVQ
jgi:hypothetical protein